MELPACQKCRLRKVRCDRQAPKCSNCAKGNVACIIVDPVNGEQYSRAFIQGLENKEKELLERLRDDRSLETTADTPAVRSSETPVGPATVESSTSHGGYVGYGSGLGPSTVLRKDRFLHSILSNAKWQHHRQHLLSQLANRPRIQHRLHISPNALPPLLEAEQLLNNYFTRFHIHHTFLLRQGVFDVFNRIYTQTNSRPSAQDFFRLLMVFGISSTTRHREGISSDDPYGYYLAAEAYLGSIPLIKDIDAIQNLLLIARFGMYHHIGTSLWEISQLCIRQCIEWRLHSNARRECEPLIEQHYRRIFWECYVLDRYSSGILGRPFAIPESEISVSLPIDAGDDIIVESSATSLDDIPVSASATPTELSVFVWCIKLRRISSRIHSAFYSGRALNAHSDGTRTPSFKSLGHVYTAFSQFRSELDAWRSSAPIFSNPNSLYERSEWHDFLYEKDKLLLARGAMHNVPLGPHAGSGVTKGMLTECYISATQTIGLYAELMERRAITWTRSYFQVIFTAGLTVIYCISLDLLKESSVTEVSLQDPLKTLTLCSTVLRFFKEKMPDAGSFAVVYDVLKDECIKDRLLPHQSHTPTTPMTEVATARVDGQEPRLNQATYPQQRQMPSLEARDANHSAVLGMPFQMPVNVDLDHFTYLAGNEMSYNYNTGDDLGLGLTDDLMNQLEASLGEYAWGSINMDTSFWNQLPYD